MAESRLIVVDTNSADDSKGVAFKLEGNLYIPVIFSALVSVGLLTMLIWGQVFSIPEAFLIAALPFAFTLFIVLTFFNGKKPHYAADLFESLTTDRSFVRRSRSQPIHPRHSLESMIAKRKKTARK